MHFVRSAPVRQKCQYPDTERCAYLNRQTWPCVHFLLEVAMSAVWEIHALSSCNCASCIPCLANNGIGSAPSCALPLNSHVALNYAPYPHGYFSGTQLRVNLLIHFHNPCLNTSKN